MKACVSGSLAGPVPLYSHSPGWAMGVQSWGSCGSGRPRCRCRARRWPGRRGSPHRHQPQVDAHRHRACCAAVRREWPRPAFSLPWMTPTTRITDAAGRAAVVGHDRPTLHRRADDLLAEEVVGRGGRRGGAVGGHRGRGLGGGTCWWWHEVVRHRDEVVVVATSASVAVSATDGRRVAGRLVERGATRTTRHQQRAADEYDGETLHEPCSFFSSTSSRWKSAAASKPLYTLAKRR